MRTHCDNATLALLPHILPNTLSSKTTRCLCPTLEHKPLQSNDYFLFQSQNFLQTFTKCFTKLKGAQLSKLLLSHLVFLALHTNNQKHYGVFWFPVIELATLLIKKSQDIKAWPTICQIYFYTEIFKPRQNLKWLLFQKTNSNIVQNNFHNQFF